MNGIWMRSSSAAVGLLALALSCEGAQTNVLLGHGACSLRDCSFGGERHVALGQAELTRTLQGNLRVGHLGSSGQDGFALVAEPGEFATFTQTGFACPNFLESKPGARQVMTVRADVPGGIFSRMTVENIGPPAPGAGDRMEIRSDFSFVGATTYTVTVLNGDTVVATFSDLPSATIQTDEDDQVIAC